MNTRYFLQLSRIVPTGGGIHDRECGIAIGKVYMAGIPHTNARERFEAACAKAKQALPGNHGVINTATHIPEYGNNKEHISETLNMVCKCSYQCGGCAVESAAHGRNPDGTYVGEENLKVTALEHIHNLNCPDEGMKKFFKVFSECMR